MSADTTVPTVTEREAILRERAAFLAACVYHDTRQPVDDADRRESVRRYPLPATLRPRVVRFGSHSFKVEHGRMLEMSVENSKWREAQGWTPFPENVAVWADLFANPTEEVAE